MIGEKRLFKYPPQYRLCQEYRLYSGQIGVIERQLTKEEADQADMGCENMFKVRFNDGFVGDIFESELFDTDLGED